MRTSVYTNSELKCVCARVCVFVCVCMHVYVRMCARSWVYVCVQAKKMEDAGFSGKDLEDYYTWMLERALEAMGHEGTWVVVVDLEGADVGDFPNMCVSFVSLSSHMQVFLIGHEGT